jgi:hypothetical protein
LNGNDGCVNVSSPFLESSIKIEWYKIQGDMAN